MRYFQNYLRHRLNPLHVYCRLRDAGFKKCTAYRVSGLYERLYRLFTPDA